MPPPPKTAIIAMFDGVKPLPPTPPLFPFALFPFEFLEPVGLVKGDSVKPGIVNAPLVNPGIEITEFEGF